jgi:hypothetical protein
LNGKDANHEGTQNGVSIKSNDLKSAATWPAPADGSPYLILDDLLVRAGLTIAPGATVAFAPTTKLTIEKDGFLEARGTADRKITFTGTVTSAPSRDGIVI